MLKHVKAISLKKHLPCLQISSISSASRFVTWRGAGAAASSPGPLKASVERRRRHRGDRYVIGMQLRHISQMQLGCLQCSMS